ncbi:MAG: ATP-binding cassette domain-containing protein [Buchnera aphidicola (Chaetogeoica yunlongensis)]
MNKLALIKCNSIFKLYTYNDKILRPILNNISFSLNSGEIMIITGSSGSGKSTLLHIISGLDTPSSGSVFFLGRDIHSMSNSEQSIFRNSNLGFIYQFHHLLLDFTAIENVALPLLIKKIGKKTAFKDAYLMLKNLGIEKKSQKYPSELSGGERQRIAIARALITRPDLIIADEPTGYLDSVNSKKVFNLLINFNKKYSTTYIIVTHDTLFLKKNFIKMNMCSGYLNII